ncbi:YrzI family small protein [Salipaludibacillus aurantiacus]|uniref:Uncharacterized protein n=1 Tax=Salipaludibacillus aurantiacus TaxID=1601833 RepID=A0A1H9SD53_9BACI|nr:YrzI family small protein [Salipaludibacillus aurantiacus]SER82303.1 tandem small hypothetical protein [Salipaludibacillus aurantiacus]
MIFHLFNFTVSISKRKFSKEELKREMTRKAKRHAELELRAKQAGFARLIK